MDIDIKNLEKFGKDLRTIYESLQGEARLEEPYGQHTYLSFMGNGRGHFAIKGYLHKGDRIGSEQSLNFEKDIDQACLKQFCDDLLRAYDRYLQD